MLTPRITSHWSDGKRLHVMGLIGGNEGDTYLQNEDSQGAGTSIQWPSEVKSNKSPLMIIPHNTFSGKVDDLAAASGYQYFADAGGGGFISNGKQYLRIFQGGAEVGDETDISAESFQFYAIFPKF